MKRDILIAALGGTTLLCACHKAEPTQGTAQTRNPTSIVTPSANPVPAAPMATGPNVKFEGEIYLDVKDQKTPSVPSAVIFDIKGDRVSYAPARQSVRAIDDLAAQRAYVISDAKRAYSELDTKPSPAAPANVRVERSTKQETVAGMACQDWTIDDGTERADVCAAPGIAFFDPAADPKPGVAEPSWARALTAQKAFPLRVVVRDHSGKEQYRAQAFEVTWRRLDDATLQVPAGFQKSSQTPDLRMASLP